MGITENILDPGFPDHRCPCVIADRIRLTANHDDTPTRAKGFKNPGGSLGRAGGFKHDIGPPAIGVAFDHLGDVLGFDINWDDRRT